MITSFLVGLAIAQDAAVFRFQPKVGDEYRYRLTMEDEQGRAQIPPSTKLFTIYKILSSKDGVFVVDQFMEATGADGKPESYREGSFKINEFLDSEQTYSSDASTSKGSEMAAAANGIFGIIFSKEPFKINTVAQTVLDVPTLAKKFLPKVPATEPQPKVTGSGTQNFTLVKLDEKLGSFKSKISFSVDIEVESKGSKTTAAMNQQTDSDITVDRTTGLPVKIDRKFNLTMRIGLDQKAMRGAVHLQRVN